MSLTYKSTAWTRADALKVHADDTTTTQPKVPYNFKSMSNKNVFIWDTMPLRDLNNEIVSVNGWSVIFTLTATRRPNEIGSVPPGTPAVPANANTKVGCVGLAVATDLTGEKWELLPPLVTAVGVNDQTERPHFVYQDNKYYLFTISHAYTYAAGLKGPDGVYGFVSENLTGPYRPLNGSGLVLGNPSSQPLQTYSHLVMKNGLVTSFIERVPASTGKDYRIGGVEAPTVRIKIKNDQTFLTEVLDYGYIPPTRNVVI